MAIDLNDSAPYEGDIKYDENAISAALRPIAYKWVPALFPMGRITEEQGCRAIRCSNIKGRPPRNRGSCRIWLEGPHAGEWVDFEDREKLKGQPLSTIKQNLGLSDGEVYNYALGIIEQYGGKLEPVRTNGHANGGGTPAVNRSEGNVKFYWDARSHASGSLIETYFASRKLGGLPPCAFSSPDGEPDMAFNASASNRYTNYGHPTMICRFRHPDGTLTGAIHLTHFLNDGSWHIGRIPAHKDQSKIVWGPRINGGVIMLAPINELGELGIGEGIESTLAGMDMYGVPGWAAGDTSAMAKFGEHLRTADPQKIAAIKRLLVWGDGGPAGESTARKVALAGKVAGIRQVELYLPRGGDDLAADLFNSLPPPSPILDFEPAEPELFEPASIGEPERPEPTGYEAGPEIGSPAAPPYAAMSAGATDARPVSLSDISSRLMALERGSDGDAVIAILRDIAAAGLDPVNREAMLNLGYRRTGIKKRALEDMLKQIEREAGALIVVAKGDAKRPWLAQMALSSDGDPKGIMSNVATVLRNAEEVKGTLGFNDFTGMISVLRKFPWEAGYPNPCQDRPWTDDDELALMEWVQATAGIHAPRGAIFDAVQRVASEAKYHPVKDYFESLVWDRRPRLETAATYYFGAEDTFYHREVLKRWIISAVARIYRPGVKADCMTVFEGDQGEGKSSALRLLFDPHNQGWFTDQLSEMGTKDASLELRGIWCAEYSDLEGMTRAEAKTIKRFMAQTTDRFRPPYGRMPIRVERQCIFGGTTNEHEYLKDATGARRFWPIKCTSIDRDALIHDVDQIWAEAVAMFIAKLSRWWIDAKDEPELALAAAGATEGRYQSDAWEAIIKRWLLNNARINTTSDELMHDALEIADRAKWSRNDQIRVGYIMRRMKWIRARDRHGAREWRYWKPGFLDLSIAEQ
jgi:putative DNA primase/helicase